MGHGKACLSAVLAAAFASGAFLRAASTDPAATIIPTRLRSMDAVIRATIKEGCYRSPLFAELLQHVERSDYFVYVEQVPALRHGMSGVLLHGGTGPRYLRVLLKRGMSLDHRVVVLAHELQHAREVMAAAIPANAIEMDALFRQIGDERMFGREQQQYETTAAIRAADTVAADLRANHRARRSALSCRAGGQ